MTLDLHAQSRDRDIVVPYITRDISRKLDAFIIHSYIYYPVFIFLFIPVLISIMITDPFAGILVLI